jgi:hypothetical protein
MDVLVLFLGRSVGGILADAVAHLGGFAEIVIVSRDGDQLEPPEGLPVVEVSKFETQPGARYTVVANGGTAAQLAPVLMRLCRAGVALKVYDLQRDGAKELS